MNGNELYEPLKAAILEYMHTVAGVCLFDLQQRFPESAGIVEAALVQLKREGWVEYHPGGFQDYVRGCVMLKKDAIVQGRLL